MIALLKKMMLVTEENPDLTAVVDREGTRRTSYRELTELSDRAMAQVLKPFSRKTSRQSSAYAHGT